METKQQLGLRLKTIRTQRKLTQEELAAILDRSVDAISNIERGKSYPSFEMVAGLSRALNVDLQEIFLIRTRQVSNKKAVLIARLVATAEMLSEQDLALATAQVEAIHDQRTSSLK